MADGISTGGTRPARLAAQYAFMRRPTACRSAVVIALRHRRGPGAFVLAAVRGVVVIPGNDRSSAASSASTC